MTYDFTAEGADAPVTDDELLDAALQWYQVRRRIRGLEEPAVIALASTASEESGENSPVPPPVEDPRPAEARSEPVVVRKGEDTTGRDEWF